MPADAVSFPLAGPSVAGTNLTVDLLLADPQRVSRLIANLALQRFFVDRVFAPAGAITFI